MFPVWNAYFVQPFLIMFPVGARIPRPPGYSHNTTISTNDLTIVRHTKMPNYDLTIVRHTKMPNHDLTDRTSHENAQL
jgi:hypothetical protein